MLLSIVIPVYNREDEMRELLESLAGQDNPDFEVIVVEDGSTHRSDKVVEEYKDRLDIKYFYKPNSGPGLTRNYGSDRSSGEYLIYLDSDCVIPSQYTNVLHHYLAEHKVDFFGGPDGAAEDFSDLQKAISYSMTSFFTTGGIRGGKRKLDKFFPRSFNMGYRREVYNVVGGFLGIKHGEDTELSYRIAEKGYNSAFIPEAYVYHKRRTTTKAFFKQVFAFGMARVNLYKRFPHTLKLVHTLPAIFTIYTIFTIINALFIYRFFALPLLLLTIIWFIDGTIKNKSVNIGILCVKTSFVQLLGYGAGFIYCAWIRFVMKKSEQESYEMK